MVIENKCKECTNSERQNPIKRESNLNAQKNGKKIIKI